MARDEKYIRPHVIGRDVSVFVRSHESYKTPFSRVIIPVFSHFVAMMSAKFREDSALFSSFSSSLFSKTLPTGDAPSLLYPRKIPSELFSRRVSRSLGSDRRVRHN